MCFSPVGRSLLAAAILLTLSALCPRRAGQSDAHLHETRVIAQIRAIHTAETQYYSQFNRYAASLAGLGPPASGNANASAADLIGNDLANGKKQGYVFTITGDQGGYVVQVMPEVYNTVGSRSFYSDQTMAVHEHYGREPATAQDPELK
jgi:hypothetical protein